jgi:hypothetical protein
MVVYKERTRVILFFLITIIIVGHLALPHTLEQIGCSLGTNVLIQYGNNRHEENVYLTSDQMLRV